MRRRIAALLSIALVAGAFTVLAPVQPAHAVWVCGGTGRAATTNPVFYPTFGGTSQNEFSFQGGVDACEHIPTGTTNKQLTATGNFLGYCGFSSGSGVTNNDELFAWIGLGSIELFTGHIMGLGQFTADFINGESCTTGADRFLVTFSIVLLNCPDDLGPGGSLDRDTLTPPLPVLGVLHFWTNGPCVPNLLDLA